MASNKATAIDLSAEFNQENFTHFVLLFNHRLAQEVCKAGFDSLIDTFEGCMIHTWLLEHYCS